MHGAHKLVVHAFDNGKPLDSLPPSYQVQYIKAYLADLGATSVVEERAYFDRDYLDEFSAFYGTSARGYPNACRRLHFFSGKPVTRPRLRSLLRGGTRTHNEFQSSYLGFSVLRPIPSAPLGRTVLRWYSDPNPNLPRVTKPSRRYVSHLCGVPLSVDGLAWQQQDAAVGACATVGLWTMFHSSAFDARHAVPTTAAITRAANRTAAQGRRVFPSSGLTFAQLAEAIKENGLAPLVFSGNTTSKTGELVGFTVDRFAASCAALLRSGYPALLAGHLDGVGLHAVCAVGFRDAGPTTAPAGDIGLQDSNVEYLYVHDDNLGPGVRSRISIDSARGVTVLRPEPPKPWNPALGREPSRAYGTFVPTQIVAATHQEIRTAPDALHAQGIQKCRLLRSAIRALFAPRTVQFYLTFGARFIRLADYLGEELQRTLGAGPELAAVRLALSEKVAPMGLHLGVVRVALDGSTPFADILFDCTDNHRTNPVFATVCFNPAAESAVRLIQQAAPDEPFGQMVPAY